MITAALVSFALLGLAWLLAPGDRTSAPEPTTEDQTAPLAKAA